MRTVLPVAALLLAGCSIAAAPGAPDHRAGPGCLRDVAVDLTNPVPVTVGPDGAAYVGDWGTGIVYRVALA